MIETNSAAVQFILLVTELADLAYKYGGCHDVTGLKIVKKNDKW